MNFGLVPIEAAVYEGARPEPGGSAIRLTRFWIVFKQTLCSHLSGLSVAICMRMKANQSMEIRLMKCPKCQGQMLEKSYGHKIRIRRCEICDGLFCKPDMVEEMLDEWMAEKVLDCGSKNIGKIFDKIDNIDCPECGVRMDKIYDQNQTHIWLESCQQCGGIFFDAWEFTDLKHVTILDFFRDFFKGKRPAGRKH